MTACFRMSLPLLLLSLAGCSSLSGTGGTDRLACPLPNGETCTALHDVYANTARAVPSSRAARAAEGSAAVSATDGKPAPRPLRAMSAMSAEAAPSPRPLRSSPRLLRAWFAPWTDSDGDLVGEMRLYLKLDDGDWQLNHVRAGVRQGVAPLRPPPPRSTPSSASASSSGSGAPPAVPSLAARPGVALEPRHPGADEVEDGE